jgi:tyrosine-protein kinase Etk/Wzc
MNNNTEFNIASHDEEGINLREELDKYLIHWKWFVGIVLVAILCAFLFLRYATPQYMVASKILIKEEGGSISSELEAFQDLGIMGGSEGNIANELHLLKSRSLTASVVKDLKLNVSYFVKGNIKETEVYGERVPFELVFLNSKEAYTSLNTTFYIKATSNSEFELFSEKEQLTATIPFGEEFSLGTYKAILYVKNKTVLSENTNRFRIRVQPTEQLIETLIQSIQIATMDKKSTVLRLSMKHPVREKAMAIINTLVVNYNKAGVNDKSEVGQRTALFINERLDLIEEDLSLVDSRAEIYKKDNKLTSVESDSELFVAQVSENEKALFDITTQMHLVDFMDAYLKKNEGSFELLPANLGFEDVSIASLSNKYNEVVLERSRILQGSSDQNPMVKNLEFQLLSYQKSIRESLVNVKASLTITLRELTRQDKKLNNKIGAIPTIEREYRNIKREQGIKEALYLYLLQKKEENEITLAVTTANSKVIDLAYGSPVPVAPRKNIVLLASVLIGLMIPFVVIYTNDLLDNKIHSRKDLEKTLSIPILGDIPLNESKEHIVVKKGSRSSSAEAFRLLRTNLDFMLTEDKENAKTIFLSSSVSGEGKSFISINLACALALSGKKVALLGMDLRAPKITEYIDMAQKKGITNYIMDDGLELNDLKINMSKHQGLDIYPSGIIPPNPAELLMHPRVEELFEKTKVSYDYVVVDTAPVNLVTDTLMIANKADLFIYVTRANYLDKRLLEVPKNLYKEKRLPNMAMLLNGTDYTKGYGYGNYGAYGYGQKASGPWWKSIFKSKTTA